MNFLVIVLSSQLLYYLLIAQTGVVGAFDSQISDLYTLPIGGVLGAWLSAYRHHDVIRTELTILFILQMIISWFYPDYSLLMLFILGFVVGYTTPLLLYIFGSQGKNSLLWGMAISYTVGTALYTYPFLQRGDIAIILPMISIIALLFASVKPIQENGETSPGIINIGVMMLWIFADSALFETLSRTEGMDIWRDHMFLIITAHLAGIFMAYRLGGDLLSKSGFILGLFAVSYLLYWSGQPLILAVVYPVVISYYNVLLFQTLIRMGNIRHIALSMIGIGWIATSAANIVALENQLWIAAAVLGIFGILYPFYRRSV